VIPLRLMLLLTLVALAGGGLWLLIAPSERLQAKREASEFFATKPDYDTSGGQPMRPRLTE
jgi:Ti type entry exclusion protein TrbK